MSLILDALRKLDREKSFLKKRNPNFVEGVLRPEAHRPQSRILPIAAASLCAAALTFALTVGIVYLNKPAPPPAAPAAANPTA
ncbi:MAG TPA: hypothetical protein VLS90_03310, partial [Thermodesulfobacteriota bacterium]|nr:hypothetical protein [Thermodesulfobacteriota bacterium]